MGSHAWMVIAHGDSIAPIHRRIHEKLADVRQHIFRLRKVNELALAGALPVVQSTEDGKRRTGTTRRIHVIDRCAGAQVEVGITAYGCQTTEGFHVAAKALKGTVGPGAAKG